MKRFQSLIVLLVALAVSNAAFAQTPTEWENMKERVRMLEERAFLIENRVSELETPRQVVEFAGPATKVQPNAAGCACPQPQAQLEEAAPLAVSSPSKDHPDWNLLGSWTDIYDLEKLNRHLVEDHRHPAYETLGQAWWDHDAHHDAGFQPTRRQLTTTIAPFQSMRSVPVSNCPGGICPAPQRHQQSGGWYPGKFLGR